MNVSEAVDYLLRIAEWIRGLGGACIVLVHPDYSFALPQNRLEYERLLRRFTSDPECDLMTLAQLADWWRLRNDSKLAVDKDRVNIVGPGRADRTELQVQWVTGLGPDGFEVRDAL